MNEFDPERNPFLKQVEPRSQWQVYTIESREREFMHPEIGQLVNPTMVTVMRGELSTLRILLEEGYEVEQRPVKLDGRRLSNKN